MLNIILTRDLLYREVGNYVYVAVPPRGNGFEAVRKPHRQLQAI